MAFIQYQTFRQFVSEVKDNGWKPDPVIFGSYSAQYVKEQISVYRESKEMTGDFWRCIPENRFGLVYQVLTQAPSPVIVDSDDAPFSQLWNAHEWHVDNATMKDLCTLLSHGHAFRVSCGYFKTGGYVVCREWKFFVTPTKDMRRLLLQIAFSWLNRGRDILEHHVVHSVPREVIALLLSEYYSARRAPILEAGYDDYMLHADAVRYRLPLVLQILAQIPRDLLVIGVGDGLGVVAIASALLKRSFFCTEPGGIGDLADLAGLLSSRGTFQDDRAMLESLEGVYCFFNTSIYFDIPDSFVGRRLIIMEQRQKDFSHLCNEVPGTHRRLWSTEKVSVYIADAYTPECANILVEGAPRDPMARYAMEQHEICINDSSQVKVAYNAKTIESPNDFVLSERKVACARSGKYGQSRYTSSDIVPFSRSKYFEFTDVGIAISQDVPYFRSDILYGHDFCGEMVMSVVVHRSPDTFKYGYNGEFIVPIVMMASELLRGCRWRVTFCRDDGRFRDKVLDHSSCD